MYERTLYRFCSKHCLDLFDADPSRYLKKAFRRNRMRNKQR
ncbi:MAG: YHS domain-containing protein [Gammaproteobacteria bacterium]